MLWLCWRLFLLFIYLFSCGSFEITSLPNYAQQEISNHNLSSSKGYNYLMIYPTLAFLFLFFERMRHLAGLHSSINRKLTFSALSICGCSTWVCTIFLKSQRTLPPRELISSSLSFLKIWSNFDKQLNIFCCLDAGFVLCLSSLYFWIKFRINTA